MLVDAHPLSPPLASAGDDDDIVGGKCIECDRLGKEFRGAGENQNRFTVTRTGSSIRVTSRAICFRLLHIRDAFKLKSSESSK